MFGQLSWSRRCSHLYWDGNSDFVSDEGLCRFLKELIQCLQTAQQWGNYPFFLKKHLWYLCDVTKATDTSLRLGIPDLQSGFEFFLDFTPFSNLAGSQTERHFQQEAKTPWSISSGGQKQRANDAAFSMTFIPVCCLTQSWWWQTTLWNRTSCWSISFSLSRNNFLQPLRWRSKKHTSD